MAEDALSPRNVLQSLPMGQQIQKLQEEAETARDKLKAMGKALNAMVSSAQDHYDSVVNFADSMALVSGSDIFQKSRDLLLDQASKRLSCVRKQEEHMSSMIKDLVEVRIGTALSMQAKVHEAIKEHEGASEKVHALKKGSPKLPEAQNQLSITQQQMDLLSFAYVNKLRQTNIDVALAMLEKSSLFFAEETVLFMAVNSSTSAILPELTKQAAELKKQRQLCEQERAKELKKHESMTGGPSLNRTAAPALQIKQGLIFCRVSGKYRQRWCSILNARLFIYKHWQASDAEKVFNLVLCNVKRIPADSTSHPYVFEIRSHLDEHMQFAATDELEMTQWINVIQNNISSQLTLIPGSSASSAHSSSGTDANNTYSASDTFNLISRVKGNERCADCRAPDPEWISFNLGITICIECSGVHRSFGSHISKVRSMKLDVLEPELVLLMTSIGNVKANTKVFEHTLPPDFLGRPGPNADRSVREAFLKAKYVEKRWIPQMEDWQSALLGLMRRKHPFKPTTLLSVLVQPGADINWKRGGGIGGGAMGSTSRSGSSTKSDLISARSADISSRESLSARTTSNNATVTNAHEFTSLPKLDTSSVSSSLSSSFQRTILHKCVMSQNFVCAILLLKRECQVDPVDASGMTPLHIAAQINAAPMVRLLLQHGAPLTTMDAMRRTPKDVAMSHDALDCVLLLSSDTDDATAASSDYISPMSTARNQRSSDPSFNLNVGVGGVGGVVGGVGVVGGGINHSSNGDSGLNTHHMVGSIASNASSPPNTARSGLAPPSPPDQVSALSSSEKLSAGDIGFVSPHRMGQSALLNARANTSLPPTQSSHSASSHSTSSHPTSSHPVGIVHVTPSKRERPAKDAPDSPLRFQSLSLRSTPPPKDTGSNVRFDDDSRLTMSARKAVEPRSTTTTDEKRTNMRRSKSAKSVPSNVIQAPLPAPLPDPVPGDAHTERSGSSSLKMSQGSIDASLPPPFILPPPNETTKESKKK